MLTIELNMYHAVALGAFLFWLGGVITDKVSLLSRYCIPAPLVGGLCFSILNCILYSMGIASINFDATLQTVFMIMFFTTVGFTVSIPALLKGGKAVILCLAISIVMIPLQNFLGGGVMALFGRDPLLGIGCGSIALVGGPGTAAAFGPDLEAAGVVGGSVVSIAAATFGLVAGSLMGGPCNQASHRKARSASRSGDRRRHHPVCCPCDRRCQRGRALHLRQPALCQRLHAAASRRRHRQSGQRIPLADFGPFTNLLAVFIFMIVRDDPRRAKAANA